jgi:hypothetical protein
MTKRVEPVKKRVEVKAWAALKPDGSFYAIEHSRRLARCWNLPVVPCTVIIHKKGTPHA